MKCSVCKNGNIIHSKTAYFANLHNRYLIIENVPCKKCTQCGLEKNINEFYENPALKDGHSSICKDCQKKISANWGIVNKERKSKLMRERYLRRKQEFAELKRLAEENGLNVIISDTNEKNVRLQKIINQRGECEALPGDSDFVLCH